MNDKHYISRLKEHRKLARMSQEQLARRAGLSTSAIQKLEAGVTRPSLENATRLAHALGVAISHLFEFEREAS